MLTQLIIHNVVLIEKLALPLQRGLNVFTGETGAGKSILLDALGLALGGRSDAGLVRAGADQASVTAEFTLDKKHAVFACAADHGLGAENPVILRRVIGKDGKSRAFFNDQPISIALLKQLGENLVEIHGQFETHGLLNAATHRGLLDSFGALGALKQQTAQAFIAWQNAQEQWQQAQLAVTRTQAEESYLRACYDELDELAPQAGEAEQLALQRAQLQHREKITEALSQTVAALDGERGAMAALAQAGKSLARVSDKAATLPDILATIDRAAAEAADASNQLARFMAALDSRPDALQKIEERLFALRALARKHQVSVDALPDLLRDLFDRLARIADAGGHLAALADAAAQARHIYVKLAQELSAKRQSAAAKFEKKIARELPALKLERATFAIDVAALPEAQWSGEGADRVAFLATTNTGATPEPLQKIASGGELARFMLALKTVLAAADPVPVLVFDEVDTGIGGAVASAVGERLARLSDNVQILVVTHSPQVAARGNHHLRVAKKIAGKNTITDVAALSKAARREEIARMLSGAEITDAARQAADSLLECC